MTLASDTKNPSPDRFAESTTTFGERAHPEPPPTLMRLPDLSSPVAEAAESMSARSRDRQGTQQDIAEKGPDVAAEVTEVPSPPVGPPVPNAQSMASSLPEPRSSFLTRALQRDYNVAAFVDRVATRKTLSLALVVVAGIAIWMPRGGDSSNTPSARVPESSEVGASASLAISESQTVDRAISPGSEPAISAENPTGIQPAFSERMVQTDATPMAPLASQPPSDSHDEALDEMDPMVAAANDQIRRMDATYADLPSVSAMDALAFEAEATSEVDDEDNPSGPLNLLMSRTPEPIDNWADYLPPVGVEPLSEQLVSGPPPATSATVVGRTVAAKSPTSAIPTTDLPAAPDFRFALPGDDALIEADAHVAMPPPDATDPVQTR